MTVDSVAILYVGDIISLFDTFSLFTVYKIRIGILLNFLNFILFFIPFLKFSARSFFLPISHPFHSTLCISMFSSKIAFNSTCLYLKMNHKSSERSIACANEIHFRTAIPAPW